jgi:Zn-dependent protease
MNLENTHTYGKSASDVSQEQVLDMLWRFFSKWSLYAGSFRGIPIRIHALIILAIILWFYGTHSSAIGHSFTVKCITFTTFLGVMLVHEMGHVIVARHFGDNVKGIVLLPPIAAVAFILLRPDKPLARIAICIAGPLINILTAILVFLFSKYCISVLEVPSYLRVFLRFLWMFSLTIGVFNLLPLFPMDGGRILKDTLLLCGASNRISNTLTMLVSFLSFLVVACWSIKESVCNVLVIITFLMLLGAAELASGGHNRMPAKEEL